MIKWLLVLPLTVFANEDAVKVSEALGHMIGKKLDSLGLDFDLEAIAKGLQDEIKGIPSPLTEDECSNAILHLQDQKITQTIEADLIKADLIFNSIELDDENYPLSASDTPEYR